MCLIRCLQGTGTLDERTRQLEALLTAETDQALPLATPGTLQRRQSMWEMLPSEAESFWGTLTLSQTQLFNKWCKSLTVCRLFEYTNACVFVSVCLCRFIVQLIANLITIHRPCSWWPIPVTQWPKYHRALFMAISVLVRCCCCLCFKLFVFVRVYAVLSLYIAAQLLHAPFHVVRFCPRLTSFVCFSCNG